MKREREMELSDVKEKHDRRGKINRGGKNMEEKWTETKVGRCREGKRIGVRRQVEGK